MYKGRIRRGVYLSLSIKRYNLRDSFSLTQYEQVIQSVLSNFFSMNLKASYIEDKYFEFILYATVGRGMLQEMGRKLKLALDIGTEKQYGFTRMEQKLYAIIYLSEDNQDDIHIEFIDSEIIDDYNLFINKAQKFFDTFSRNYIVTEGVSADNIPSLISSYYIDVLDSYKDIF